MPTFFLLVLLFALFLLVLAPLLMFWFPDLLLLLLLLLLRLLLLLLHLTPLWRFKRDGFLATAGLGCFVPAPAVVDDTAWSARLFVLRL